MVSCRLRRDRVTGRSAGRSGPSETNGARDGSSRRTPPAEIETLTKDLEELEQSGLAQAIIYIDSSLPAGAVLEELTPQSANAWGVGRKGADDGLATFIFVKDRRMRIEVGRGLEKAISNDDAKSIIDEQLRPAFRQGRFADGLTQAIGSIRDLLRHRPTQSRS
jgi:uncharacterized protein